MYPAFDRLNNKHLCVICIHERTLNRERSSHPMYHNILTACTRLTTGQYDDDDEIAYFTVCRKTTELVLSTAQKTSDNTDKDSKM